MEELIYYSLERISSLQHFYKSEQKSIMSKANQGMKTNRFAHLAVMYFELCAVPKDLIEKDTLAKFEELKEKISEWLEVTEVSEDGKSFLYRIKNLDILKKRNMETNISAGYTAFRKFADMPIIHSSNTLVMLITRFEEFIANILTQIYILYPQKYLDGQLISFSEIASDGIEDVRQKIISRQIDAIMRESYEEWFKLFESHGMSFAECTAERETLKEIYARRNIVVHNSGRVNSSYLSSVPHSKDEIGSYLNVTESYLDKAFETVTTIIYVILIEAARLIKEDKNEFLYAVFQECFEELKRENYTICCKAFKLLAANKFLDTQTQTFSRVNYWIAQKELDGLDSIKEEIQAFDVSALSREFSLAKEILLENYDTANMIMEDLYKKKDLSAPTIEDWPLFKRYRLTEQYKQFKGNHPDDFNVSAIETGREPAPPSEEASSLHKELDVFEGEHVTAN